LEEFTGKIPTIASDFPNTSRSIPLDDSIQSFSAVDAQYDPQGAQKMYEQYKKKGKPN
jgi:hypothetical protein